MFKVIKRQFKLIFLILVFFITGIAVNFSVKATGANQTRPEIRAIWVNAFQDGAKNPAQIDKLINDCLLANLNTIIVQVRCRGEAYYNKSIEPRAEDPALPPGFDPLQYLIDKAHAHGIEVHAWLNTLVVWSEGKNQPQDPQHLWNLHGPNAIGPENWISYSRKYNSATRKWSNELYSSYFLDPGHPAAVDYTVNLYLNIVKNYDVDGIHLDYSRYCGLGWGYNSTSVERFNRCYGTTGLPLPDNLLWKRWRREQTANLVRKIYLQTIALKPQMKVSSAVVAWGKGPVSEADWERSQAYTIVGQDWRSWLEEGIIDLAIPMNYFSEWKPSNQKFFRNWIEWEKDHQYGRQIIIGTGLYLQYIEDCLEQIRNAQQPSKLNNSVAGVALYTYNCNNLYGNQDFRDPRNSRSLPRQPHVYQAEANNWLFPLLSKDGSYRDPVWQKEILTKPVFPTPAPIPDMPWKSHPTKGYLMGTVTTPSGKKCDYLQITLMTVNLKKFEPKCEIYTDGSGWYGCTELPPGNYYVWVDKQHQPRQTPTVITIRAGQVTEANLTVPVTPGKKR